MPTSVFSEFIFVTLALFATGGLGAAWYSYTRYPWERVNRESRVPVRERTVELTRLGVSVGFAMCAPIALGAWAYYAGTMASLRATAGREFGQPSLFDRVAIALPGEVIMGAGFAVAVVGMVGPLVLVFWDGATALVGRREA